MKAKISDSRGKEEEAVALHQRVLEAQPDYVESLNYLGTFPSHYCKLLIQAVRCLQVLMFFFIGLFYLKEGDYDAARRNFKRVNSSAPCSLFL
jgi:hypothetical protein